MFKTGTTTLQELQADNSAATPWLKRLRNISISLYPEACKCTNNTLAERILLLFSDERGAYKRTYANRFEDFDPIVLQHLKDHFTDKNITLHDVSVSDGRTAVDFFHKCDAAFPNLVYTASDYCPFIYLLTKGRLKVALSENNQLLEVTYPPFVFNIVKRDSYLLYPLNHIIRELLQLFLVNPLVKSYKQGRIQATKIMLFAPSVLKLAETKSSFKLAQHDITKPFSENYDVIRAMNILNPSYFTPKEFQQILQNIHTSLNDNGLFVTGSNQDAGSIVNGGIYQKTLTGFNQIWQSGTGSHINNKISKFNITY